MLAGALLVVNINANAQQQFTSHVASLSVKQILKLSKDKQIEYIKSYRDMVSAAEEAQLALKGRDFYEVALSSEKDGAILNKFFQLAIVGEAWAADSCIIAGNIGEISGGKCTFNSEEKVLNKQCDQSSGRKIACNPTLFGEGACVAFSTPDERAHATAHCSSQFGDVKRVMDHFEKLNAGKDANKDFFKDLDDYINKTLGICSKNITSAEAKQKKNSKKLTDQEQTCLALRDRTITVGPLVCEKKADGLSAEQLASRQKACKKSSELNTEACEAKLKLLGDQKTELDNNCKDPKLSPPEYGRQVGIDLPGCYGAINECIKGDKYQHKQCWSGSKTSSDIIKESNKTFQDGGDYKKKLDEIKAIVEGAPADIKMCFEHKELKIGETSLISDTEYDNFQKVEQYSDAGYSEAMREGNCYKTNLQCKRTASEFYTKKVIGTNEDRIRLFINKANRCLTGANNESLKKSILASANELKKINQNSAGLFKENKDMASAAAPDFSKVVEYAQASSKNVADWFNPESKGANYKVCCKENPPTSPSPFKIGTGWCDGSQNGVGFITYGLTAIPAVHHAPVEERSTDASAAEKAEYQRSLGSAR